jgi:hypothetical protein
MEFVDLVLGSSSEAAVRKPKVAEEAYLEQGVLNANDAIPSGMIMGFVVVNIWDGIGGHRGGALRFIRIWGNDTSCIKQMPRISVHLFAITSFCLFFLIHSSLRSESIQFGRFFSCLFSDDDGDHHLALGCRLIGASTRPTFARSRPAQRECPSVLAPLFLHHHHSAILKLSSLLYMVFRCTWIIETCPKIWQASSRAAVSLDELLDASE